MVILNWDILNCAHTSDIQSNINELFQALGKSKLTQALQVISNTECTNYKLYLLREIKAILCSIILTPQVYSFLPHHTTFKAYLQSKTTLIKDAIFFAKTSVQENRYENTTDMFFSII